MVIERRKQLRHQTAHAVQINLNPDHHFVQMIRRMGVPGTIRNVSSSGIMIDSQLDILDVCHLFPEELEENSPFELELSLSDSRGRRTLLRGRVRWYQLREPNSQGLRLFQAGLQLREENISFVTETVLRLATQRPAS